jgi:hypothetical protein
MFREQIQFKIFILHWQMEAALVVLAALQQHKTDLKDIIAYGKEMGHNLTDTQVIAALQQHKTDLKDIIAYGKEMGHNFLTDTQVIDAMLTIARGRPEELKKAVDSTEQSQVANVCAMIQCLSHRPASDEKLAIEAMLWARFDRLAMELCKEH